MIPWQIYADYLEDKGFDTRLFRVAQPIFDYKTTLNNGDVEEKPEFTAHGDGWDRSGVNGDGHGSPCIDGNGYGRDGRTYNSYWQFMMDDLDDL